jgi:septal ring factor EnvC (AmiA/AmiB activator)
MDNHSITNGAYFASFAMPKADTSTTVTEKSKLEDYLNWIRQSYEQVEADKTALANEVASLTESLDMANGLCSIHIPLCNEQAKEIRALELSVGILSRDLAKSIDDLKASEERYHQMYAQAVEALNQRDTASANVCELRRTIRKMEIEAESQERIKAIWIAKVDELVKSRSELEDKVGCLSRDLVGAYIALGIKEQIENAIKQDFVASVGGTSD